MFQALWHYGLAILKGNADYTNAPRAMRSSQTMMRKPAPGLLLRKHLLLDLLREMHLTAPFMATTARHNAFTSQPNDSSSHLNAQPPVSGGFSAYPGSNADVGGRRSGDGGFRSATPDKKGRFSDSVYNELESQNDEQVGVMTEKVKMLKNVRLHPTEPRTRRQLTVRRSRWLLETRSETRQLSLRR